MEYCIFDENIWYHIVDGVDSKDQPSEMSFLLFKDFMTVNRSTIIIKHLSSHKYKNHILNILKKPFRRCKKSDQKTIALASTIKLFSSSSKNLIETISDIELKNYFENLHFHKPTEHIREVYRKRYNCEIPEDDLFLFIFCDCREKSESRNYIFTNDSKLVEICRRSKRLMEDYNLYTAEDGHREYVFEKIRESYS